MGFLDAAGAWFVANPWAWLLKAPWLHGIFCAETALLLMGTPWAIWDRFSLKNLVKSLRGELKSVRGDLRSARDEARSLRRQIEQQAKEDREARKAETDKLLAAMREMVGKPEPVQKEIYAQFVEPPIRVTETLTMTLNPPEKEDDQ